MYFILNMRVVWMARAHSIWTLQVCVAPSGICTVVVGLFGFILTVSAVCSLNIHLLTFQNDLCFFLSNFQVRIYVVMTTSLIAENELFQNIPLFQFAHVLMLQLYWFNQKIKIFPKAYGWDNCQTVSSITISTTILILKFEIWTCSLLIGINVIHDLETESIVQN